MAVEICYGMKASIIPELMRYSPSICKDCLTGLQQHRVLLTLMNSEGTRNMHRFRMCSRPQYWWQCSETIESLGVELKLKMLIIFPEDDYTWTRLVLIIICLPQTSICSNTKEWLFLNNLTFLHHSLLRNFWRLLYHLRKSSDILTWYLWEPLSVKECT